MRVGIYDPKDVVFIVGGRKVEGFGEGAFIEVTRTNPTEMIAKVGALGNYVVSRNQDKSGTITANILVEAEVAVYLDSLAGSSAIVPIFLGRKGETIQEIVSAPEGWIQERPQENYQMDTPTDRGWIIGVGRLTQKAVSI